MFGGDSVEFRNPILNQRPQLCAHRYDLGGGALQRVGICSAVGEGKSKEGEGGRSVSARSEFVHKSPHKLSMLMGALLC